MTLTKLLDAMQMAAGSDRQGFALKVTSSSSRISFLVRVGSCDFVDRACFSGQKERSTKSHELNTKLVTTEIDF